MKKLLVLFLLYSGLASAQSYQGLNVDSLGLGRTSGSAVVFRGSKVWFPTIASGSVTPTKFGGFRSNGQFVTRTPGQVLSDIGAQPALSGTGFVKISGTTISYDNNTYVTASALSGYLPLTGGTLTGALLGTSLQLSSTLLSQATKTNTINPASLSGNFFGTGGFWGLRTGNDDSFNIDVHNSNSPFNAFKITQTGVATLASSLTATSFIKSGGTSSQFLKADGSVETASFSSYLPLTGGTLSGTLNGTNVSISGTFTGAQFVKSGGTNVQFLMADGITRIFGTGSGDIAEGNDSRINNGQTAFGWGNHASAGYAPLASPTFTGTVNASLISVSSTVTSGQFVKSGGTNSQFLMADGITRTFGTGSGDIAEGNDSRIVNAAPLASPAFTGTPTAPTQSAGDNSTRLATTAYVATAVAAGGSGVTTMAAIGGTPNANGASISGITLTLQPASSGFGGVLTNGVQSIAGAKTFLDFLSVTTAGNGIIVQTSHASAVPLIVTNTGGAELLQLQTASTVPFRVANSGALTITSPNSFGARLFSGASGSFSYLSIGRTAEEHQIGVSAGAGQFITGSVAGDLVINSTTGKMMFGTGANPALTISTAQLLRANAYGAGTLTTDASGNITATSDSTAKENFEPYTKGLAALRDWKPKTYNWKKETGLDTTHRYTSLIAQDVQKTAPEGVFPAKKGGYLGVQDRVVQATVVNAVNELHDIVTKQQTQIEDLKSEVIILKNK